MNISKIALALLPVVACVGCNEQQTSAPLPRTVVLSTPRPTQSSKNISFPGKVKASADASLSFRVAGQIDKIFVREGQKVSAGQLLALLDTTDYRIQLDATEAEYKQIRAQVDRVVQLYKDSVSTANDYDKAVYGLRQIEAKYQHHKDQLSYTRLVAPFDGYIGKRTADAHEIVAAGMPVLSMVAGGLPEVEINLPAADYVRRAEFDKFSCVFDVFPGQTFLLTPLSWSAQANANQLYTLRLKMTSAPAEQPTPGMSTTVSIGMRQGQTPIFSLPATAVVENDGRSGVFVYDSSSQSVHFLPIDIGQISRDGQAEVSADGLDEQTQVVVSGVHSLRNGQSVRPLPAVSETNVGGLL